MKRPQSAKPGHKGQWGQSSAEDINDPHIQQPRKQVRIMKPDLTTHDFARILPRRIQQDKERLYSEALQLKQALHEVAEENVRLKTKISVIEREKEKLNRFVDTAPEGLGKASRLAGGQRLTEKDNMIIRNLKKLVRECRDQNDGLRVDNQKIKKMMKYTKINELEIERKVMIEQNKRLSTMLEQYSSQFVNQEEIQRENEELKKYLEQEMEEKNQIEEQREKYEEIIDQLEEKIKSDTQKFQNKEKKLLKDLNMEKRRAQDLQRRNEQLHKELKSIKESQSFLEQRQKTAKSNIRTSKVQKTHKVNTQQSQPSESDKKYLQVRRHNEELSRELQHVKERLRKAESQMSMMDDRSKVHINQSQLNFTQNDEENYESPSKVDQHQASKSSLKKSEQHQQHDVEEEYEEEFEKEETKIKESKESKLKEHNDSKLKSSKEELGESKEEEQIEKYKKDFEENEEEQEIYKKEEKPRKGKPAGKKEKKAGKGQAYKPNKKMLAQIKELLTYRMKSQRYPFTDIKSDIESAQTNQFTYSDLCNMLVNQPFYLTSDYTRAFLSYCFEKERVQPAEAISSAVLVGKLRRVIDDFPLMQEAEEKEMIIRIAEMTSTYPRELQVAFENIKNGEETVGRQDLIEMFKKLELQDKYIDLIIAELSLCSDDLEHLNFHGFFERFYIEDDGEEYMDNNAIEEEESEESYRHSSRVKRQRGKEGEEEPPEGHHS